MILDKNELIISFSKGLPGFEDLKTFTLKEIEDTPPFKLLQSNENQEIAFVTIVPFDFKRDYEVKLTDTIIAELQIEKEEDVLILNTVTLHSDVKKITTNLRAPIIINLKNNKGYQLILDREDYKIKHPLMEE